MTAGRFRRGAGAAWVVLTLVLLNGLVLPGLDGLEHLLGHGPVHTTRPHFEDPHATAHSDHCILGRTVTPPVVASSTQRAPTTGGQDSCLTIPGAGSSPRGPVDLLPSSRAPPSA